MRSLFHQGLRFSVAGGLNTLFSLAIYQIALLLVPHAVAYAICWVAGIIFLVMLYPGRVFGVTNSTWIQKSFVALLYVATFFSGLLLLNQLVSHGIRPEWAIFIVLAFTTVINFFGMRGILKAKS